MTWKLKNNFKIT